MDLNTIAQTLETMREDMEERFDKNEELHERTAARVDKVHQVLFTGDPAYQGDKPKGLVTQVTELREEAAARALTTRIARVWLIALSGIIGTPWVAALLSGLSKVLGTTSQ